MSGAAFIKSVKSVGDSTEALNVLKSIRSTGDLGDVLSAISRSDMNNLLKKIDVNDLNQVLKNVPDDQLAKIGKNLDPEILKTIDNINPELAGKLGKQTPIVVDATTRVVKSVGEGLVNVTKKLSGATKKKIEDIGKIFKKGESAGDQGKNVAKEVSEQTPSAAKAADDATEAVPAAKDGLKKLGMYTAGGTLLLMLVYNTSNPFRAIERALNDAGEVAQGVKEVADAAAGAIKDTAVGGFNFISFITKNAWISGSMSILCMILVVGLLATSMLGGNNRGGRRLRN